MLSGYRAMWLFAMFDLPVDSRESRRAYTKFRHTLLREGFVMLQFSVYARFLPSEEADQAFRRRIRKALPDDGQVRLISITDRQFEKMDCFIGKKRKDSEEPPAQRMLF